MNRSTLCVVLHYGSAISTWNCLRTLLAIDALDILVADNDPKQSLSVPSAFLGRVEVVRTGGLAGFAEANNIAVGHGRKPAHDTLLLLNNDTLLGGDALPEMLAVLHWDDVGAVGPCMPVMESGGGIWACGGVINSRQVAIAGRQPPADGLPCDVDYLPGAAILCRLEVWDLVGGLPETYFLGFEEAEFALRVKSQGYRVMVAPQAIVLHDVGMSSDRQPMYVYNSIRSRVRFGQFLWGRKRGLLLSALNTLREARDTHHGLKLWARALADEVGGKALDRAALQDVAARYQ